MPENDPAETPRRERIGPIDGHPVTTHPDLSKLPPHQRALRQAAIKEFKAKKVRKFVEREVSHINTNARVAEGIRFLFDEHGQPPANSPIEDVIEERKRIEHEIRWFEAILIELRDRLVKMREIEDMALDLLDQDSGNAQEQR